jgi:two-component system chemotaxis response regulator CheB
VLITGRLLGADDGLRLIRWVRRRVRPVPLIVLRTALSSPRARSEALESEADEFLLEPVTPKAVLATVENALRRLRQPAPDLPSPPARGAASERASLPRFAAAGLAASAGGPGALISLLGALPQASRAAVLVVQHGRDWMLEALAERLGSVSLMPVHLGEEGMPVEEGTVYLAPGGRHMTVAGDSLELRLRDDPPENFLRPAADPLFRSLADAFGPRCLAVVLTGMGRDGALGAARVLAAGGAVLAQDPGGAVAPSMPQTLVAAGIPDAVLSLDRLAGEMVRRLASVASDR